MSQQQIFPAQGVHLGILSLFQGNESALIRAATRGDRAAFDTLVRDYSPGLRGFLVRRVGPAIADDIMQDTWIAAWSAVSRFNGRSKFKAWLYGIALHKAADALRSHGRNPAESWSDMLDDQLTSGNDPFDAADRAYLVRKALAEMPDAQREVLELYYYAELTLAEIAESLGRNLNTVKYQFYRAHAAAADRLQEFNTTTGGTIS